MSKMNMNTDGIRLPNGECPCNGDNCSGAFGWVWNTRDLGHTNHRGKMWATICPSWNKTEMAWNTETGEFAEQRVEPAPPPGIEGDFNRYRQHNWDNVKQSQMDLKMNNMHERGTGADIGTHKDHEGVQ